MPPEALCAWGDKVKAFLWQEKDEPVWKPTLMNISGKWKSKLRGWTADLRSESKGGQWASQNQKSKIGSYFPISLSFRRGMPRSTELVHLSQVKLQVSSKTENENPGLPNSMSAYECLGLSWYGWSWQIKRWGVLRSVTSISPIETEHDCEAGPLSFLWAHYPLPHIHTWGPLRCEKQKTSSYQLFGKKTAVWPVCLEAGPAELKSLLWGRQELIHSRSASLQAWMPGSVLIFIVSSPVNAATGCALQWGL